MLLDVCLGSKAAWRILILLGESPGRGITKPEISRHTKLGGNALFLTINSLEKFGLITKEKTGKKTYYKINKANPYSQDIISLVSRERQDLNSLNPEISIPVREFGRQVLHLDIYQIYLFGSTVKGQYKEGSDIDLAIVLESEPGTKARMHIEEASGSLAKRFKREVQIHYFTKEQFEAGRKKGNPLVEEIIRDGIKLLG